MKLDEKYFEEKLDDVMRGMSNPETDNSEAIDALQQIARDAAEEQRGLCFANGCEMQMPCYGCENKLDIPHA